MLQLNAQRISSLPFDLPLFPQASVGPVGITLYYNFVTEHGTVGCQLARKLVFKGWFSTGFLL